MKVDSDVFLSTIAIAIQQSEGVFCNDIEKLIATSTIQMLFFKFGLSQYLDEYEISKADYKQWFFKPAKELEIDSLLQDILFDNGEEDDK